jgi:hypothetical protein
MKRNRGDGMIRIEDEIYEFTKQYCSQANKNIKEIVGEALKEWFENHIDKEQKKLIEKIIFKNKN